MQDKLLSMLMQKEEITWQTIILDLIKSGELNPWNIDLSILTSKYLEIIRGMQEANLFISAKVLLASALLLKIKSERLLTEGIAAIDFYLYPQDDVEELDPYIRKRERIELDIIPRLTVKNPLARKRRITVNDLMSALGKALDVNERRILKHTKRYELPPNFRYPVRKVDINKIMGSLLIRIKTLLEKRPIITFFEISKEDKREDKIMNFISLLYLTYQEKIDINQEEHFGNINISLIRHPI